MTSRKYRCAISRLWGAKTPPIPLTPLSHLQKGSKPSCVEIQHFDIFSQPWCHLWTTPHFTPIFAYFFSFFKPISSSVKMLMKQIFLLPIFRWLRKVLSSYDLGFSDHSKKKLFHVCPLFFHGKKTCYFFFHQEFLVHF